MSEFIVTILKFCLAVLLLPVVIATFVGFEHHLGNYPSSHSEFFRWGIFAFLITFLFLYQFWSVYEFGQRTMANMMSFLSPADRIIARLVPFYLTITMILFYGSRAFFGVGKVSPYYMFFAGFAFAMHILLTAQDMQQEETTPIKPTYFFWMSVNFVVVIILTVLLFDLVFDKWTFPKFLNEVLDATEKFYRFSFYRDLKF